VIPLLALIVVAAPACGGQVDSASSGTQTMSPSTPTGASSSSTSDTGLRQFELDTYLDAVYLPWCTGDASERRASRAFTKVSPHGYDGWAPAAAQSRRTAVATTRVADELATVVPPGDLASVHAAYATFWRDDSMIYADLASVLRHNDHLDWSVYNARWHDDDRSVSRYRIAVIAYASTYHLRLAPWFRKIGR
jgi:hypothetical protein